MQRVCLLWLIVIVGCGGSSKPPAKGSLSATWHPPAMLAHVPADSPYVLGVIDPIAQEFRDRMFAVADKRMAEAMAALDKLPADFDRSTLPGYVRAMLVAFDELRGKDLTHWGSELGFDPSGRFVLYGLSVWPVLRVAVSDPEKLRRLAKRMLAVAGMRVDEGALGGRAYWKFEDKGVTVVAAVLADEAVVSVFPTSVASTALPLVLGIQNPSRTLHDTTTLPDLVGHYDLMPAMIGYLDLRAAANFLTHRMPSTEPALDKPLADAAGPVSPDCRGEIDRLVELVPKIILGYHKLDNAGMHARFIAEMPPAVTRAIAKLRVAVPEVTTGLSGHPLGSFGVAASIDEAIPLLRGVARQVDQHPFRCTWLAPLNKAAADVLPVLERPLPPALQGLRGGVFVVDDVVKEPFTVTGHALVVGARARDALQLLLKNLPGLGGVVIPTDASAVPLPLAFFGVPPSVTVHAAASSDRVGIAIGEASVTRAPALLQTASPAHSPLMSFGMDMIRWRALGLLDEKDQKGMMEMRDVVMQLDVLPEGLVLEMYATFPP